VGNPNIPRPDGIRDPQQATRGWGWIDHRIDWFWEDLDQQELLVYFYLSTVADRDGCSWHSVRTITRILKIGPASLIKARDSLAERGLIAFSKDDFSKRIMYQVLPLPIEQNERVEIPIKKEPSSKKKNKTAQKADTPTEEQHQNNLMYLSKIQEIIDKK